MECHVSHYLSFQSLPIHPDNLMNVEVSNLLKMNAILMIIGQPLIGFLGLSLKARIIG